MRREFVGVLLAVSMALAGEWQSAFSASYILSQSAYSDNWDGDEVGNIAWKTTASFSASGPLGNRFTDQFTADFSFGQTHFQDPNTGNWLPPSKNEDEIDIENVLSMPLHFIIDPYFSLHLESQFADNTRDKLVILNPIDLSEALGVGRILWSLDNGSKMAVRTGFSLRESFNRNVPDTDNISVQTQGGAEMVAEWEIPFAKSAGTYSGKLSLFKAVVNSAAENSTCPDCWKAIDAEWENELEIELIKYVVLNFSFELLYDKEINPRGRFRESLGLGLSYKFPSGGPR